MSEHLLYIYVCVCAALWYLMAMERETECQKKAGMDNTECASSLFYCYNSFGDYTFIYEYCPTIVRDTKNVQFWNNSRSSSVWHSRGGKFFEEVYLLFSMEFANSQVCHNNNIVCILFPHLHSPRTIMAKPKRLQLGHTVCVERCPLPTYYMYSQYSAQL